MSRTGYLKTLAVGTQFVHNLDAFVVKGPGTYGDVEAYALQKAGSRWVTTDRVAIISGNAIVRLM